jgi:hypothetical protein
MRRVTIVLGMTSLALAVTLVVRVYVEPGRGETEQGQQTPSIHKDSIDTLDESRAVVPSGSVGDSQDPAVAEGFSDGGFVEENTTRRARADENTVREDVRKDATRDIHEAYSLLFEDLGLTPQEKDALFEFLIEVRIASTDTGYQRSTTMDEVERANRIWNIIGYPKLQQFLALEQNLFAYSEVQRIGSMLERRGVPVTETQRDGLFDMLVTTRNEYLAPSNIERSIEGVEQIVAQIDERERHVIELAPSVLSPRQVAYLHERYQQCSDVRARSLELLRQRRADDPDSPLFLWGCAP